MTDIDSNNENNTVELNLPISLIPFAIQLQNIVPIDIVARRFPVNIIPESPVNIQANIVGQSVDIDHQQAQILIEAKVEPNVEPRSFEIKVNVVGIFTYSDIYSADDVQKYLQQGSISVILPFIRELILQLSIRLQIPPIILPIIQLAASTDMHQHEQ